MGALLHSSDAILFPAHLWAACLSLLGRPIGNMAGLPPFEIKRILIVGGGNAAQAMGALFPSRGYKTNMLCNYADEADRINAAIKEQGYMSATFAEHNTPSGLVKGTPDKIAKSAADVLPGCNVVILPLPSLAYRSVLEELKPHLQPGTYIGVTPGQGGFDWLAKEVLGDLAKDLVFFALMPMPFNCRITEFGKHVAVQVFKSNYRIGTLPPSAEPQVLSICTQLFGKTESCGHFLSTTLYPINAIIHPQRLYALCHPAGREPYSASAPLESNPFFYEDIDDQSADLMNKVNAELIDVAARLKAAGMPVDVPHIFDFLAKFVYQDESPDLKTFFATCSAYKGFRCPLKQAEDGGWHPDFHNRYFTEDIPFGLCIYKGVADIVGAETPVMDMVLAWAQEGMGKEYIVDGRLTGKDVGETAAPQRWGITDVQGLSRGGA